MNVCLVGGFLRPFHTGLWTHLRRLVLTLPRIAPHHRFSCVTNREALPLLGGVPSLPYPVSDRPYVRRLWWNNVVLPPRLARFDLVHVCHHFGPVRLRAPMVVSVLDTMPLQLPRMFPASHVFHHRRILPLALRRAAAILTISEASKRHILSDYGVDERKVHVVPLGVEPVDAEPHRADRPYLLAVGALVPRKNFVRLIEAFATLRRRGLPHRLILAGPPAYGAAEVDAAVSRLGVQDHVAPAGYVGEEELWGLYRGASAFVLPSLLEGFGLPALEAMSCGVPVVVSRGTALEEVVGTAGVTVDPLSVVDIASGIERALGDASLGAAGRERARAFTWERFARGVLAVYDGVPDRL